MNHAFLLPALVVLSFCLLQNNSCKDKTADSPAPRVSTTPATAKTMTTNSSNSPSPASGTTAANQQLSGVWGGLHVTMEISSDSVTLEFDCASGSIREPLVLDSAGHFDVGGSYNRQGPGPTREGAKTDSDARYSGAVNGNTMKLSVQLPGSSEILEFSLTRGRPGKITKCY
ncbi:MAG TPA: hypothetical protein VIW64_02355 [Pyrinomonadaceae bacterium]|jgi:hypothetical protein